QGRADYIVVPFENSTHGSVYQNYDNISKYDFTIIGEVYLRINFHLIVNPGTKLEDIANIYSHPVGLNQIREFLRNHKNIKDIEYDDTAGSAKMIRDEGKKDSAAAASRLAAELYGMEILEENIHENQKNFTRFFVLSKNGKQPKELKDRENNKTSIQFL